MVTTKKDAFNYGLAVESVRAGLVSDSKWDQESRMTLRDKVNIASNGKYDIKFRSAGKNNDCGIVVYDLENKKFAKREDLANLLETYASQQNIINLPEQRAYSKAAGIVVGAIAAAGAAVLLLGGAYFVGSKSSNIQNQKRILQIQKENQRTVSELQRDVRDYSNKFANAKYEIGVLEISNDRKKEELLTLEAERNLARKLAQEYRDSLKISANEITRDNLQLLQDDPSLMEKPLAPALQAENVPGTNYSSSSKSSSQQFGYVKDSSRELHIPKNKRQRPIQAVQQTKTNSLGRAAIDVDKYRGEAVSEGSRDPLKNVEKTGNALAHIGYNVATALTASQFSEEYSHLRDDDFNFMKAGDKAAEGWKGLWRRVQGPLNKEERETQYAGRNPITGSMIWLGRVTKGFLWDSLFQSVNTVPFVGTLDNVAVPLTNIAGNDVPSIIRNVPPAVGNTIRQVAPQTERSQKFFDYTFGLNVPAHFAANVLSARPMAERWENTKDTVEKAGVIGPTLESLAFWASMGVTIYDVSSTTKDAGSTGGTDGNPGVGKITGSTTGTPGVTLP